MLRRFHKNMMTDWISVPGAARNGAGRGLCRTCCAALGPDRAGCVSLPDSPRDSGSFSGPAGPRRTAEQPAELRWVRPGSHCLPLFFFYVSQLVPSCSCCRKEGACVSQACLIATRQTPFRNLTVLNLLAYPSLITFKRNDCICIQKHDDALFNSASAV